MKNIISGIIGLVVGVLLTLVIIYKAAPGMMLLVDPSPYNFEEAVTKFKDATKAKGWKLPTIHDMQKTMKKFNQDVRPAMVFELCHPVHAGRILAKSEERKVVSLMPCRVAIYEKADGKVYISRMNSSLMASMMGGIIPEVMDTAAKETEVILQSILTK